MSRGAKWGVGLLAALLLIGAVAFVNREEILLGLVGFVIKQRVPVGPNQDVAWSSGADPRGRAPEERPPNIVLILADDLGWNDLTFGGGGVAGGTVPTPHIDSIAAEGVNFTNGYAANGTCAPSRAALLSGRYGTRFGFEFTPTPPGMMQLAALLPRPAGRLRPAIPVEGAESSPTKTWACPPRRSRSRSSSPRRAITRYTSASGTSAARTAWRPRTRASTRVC